MRKKIESIVIVGEQITDPDIRAIYLINEAILISTPRMVRANFEFVLGSNKWSKKYNLRFKPTGRTKR